MPNTIPVHFQPRRASRQEISEAEAQRDPIFLIRKREYRVLQLPKWIDTDGDSYWVDITSLDRDATELKDFCNLKENPASGEAFIDNVDENKLMPWLCTHSRDGHTDDDNVCAVEVMTTVGVTMTRSDAEKFASERSHRYPYGYDVFCVSAVGELATFLCSADPANNKYPVTAQ